MRLRCSVVWAGLLAVAGGCGPGLLAQAPPDVVQSMPAVPASAPTADPTNLAGFSPEMGTFAGVTDAPPRSILLAADTNGAVPGEGSPVATFNTRLAAGLYYARTRQPDKAAPLLTGLLSGGGVPEAVRQTALFELAGVERAGNDLSRAASVYAQFLDRWPKDARVPEVLLRQGQVFRQMGLNSMALSKFYAVMASALSLKDDQFSYYQRLVLQAQLEIAATHYAMGQYADAADFYSRLLKQDDPVLDRPQTQFRLVRSLASVGHSEEAASQAQDFLSRYPDAPEEPEVRFYLAEALKELGRNGESLQQVLLLLQEEKEKTRDHPDTWAYWQERAGNEIANQLYREGDYVKALDVYMHLAELDSAPAWQLPVQYQMGITYERLLQPEKAVETYNRILQHESDLGTNASPALSAIFDMARWRIGFIAWQNSAEKAERQIAVSARAPANGATNAPSNTQMP